MSETLLGSDGGQAPQEGNGASPGNEGNTGDQQDDSVRQNDSQQPAADAWMQKFEGEDLGWLQNRGLIGKNPDEAIANLVKAQRSAEKRFGVPQDRLLTLPPDPTSEGAMDAVYDALGRPKDGAGYELDPGDTDLTKQFADKLGETFHKIGLNKNQGQAVEKVLEDFFGEQFDQQQEQTTEQRAAAMSRLKGEWGDTFDMNLELAKEAVKAAGATKEELEALEDAFGENGNATMIRFFNRLGQKRGLETGFIASDPAQLGVGATTPEAAKAKLAEMKAEPKIARAILENNPNNEHVKRYRALIQLATKGQAA